jgi:hypothetical protein
MNYEITGLYFCFYYNSKLFEKKLLTSVVLQNKRRLTDTKFKLFTKIFS